MKPQAKKCRAKRIKNTRNRQKQQGQKYGQHEQQKLQHIIMVKRKQITAKKTQWNGRTTSHYICNEQTTGIVGGKEGKKHNNARSNNAKTQQTRARKSAAQKMQ